MNIPLIAKIEIEFDRFGENICLTGSERESLSKATHIQIIPVDENPKLNCLRHVVKEHEDWGFNTGIGKSFSVKESSAYKSAWKRYLKKTQNWRDKNEHNNR